MGDWKGWGLQGRAWACGEDQPWRKPSLALSKPQWPHLQNGNHSCSANTKGKLGGHRKLYGAFQM